MSNNGQGIASRDTRRTGEYLRKTGSLINNRAYAVPRAGAQVLQKVAYLYASLPTQPAP
jgi:hypothetical protein